MIIISKQGQGLESQIDRQIDLDYIFIDNTSHLCSFDKQNFYLQQSIFTLSMTDAVELMK